MHDPADDADDTLDGLVAECLAELERRGPQALETVCAAHPEHAPRLRARLEALAAAGLLEEPDAPPERLGDYRLGARLGGGGMGVVYAAVQESLDREVALKVVRADQLFFPGARERFRREVRLIASLAHGAIVPVHAVGEDGGVPYFSMERLRGATVAEALAQLDGPPARGADLARAVGRVVAAREGGAPDACGAVYAGDGVHAALLIARRIAEALAHAHSRGVLHRDVKPSNVMLTTDGRALLFDFGLASSEHVSRLTRTGSRVGSLAYMAPEQARGEALDERGDVYGLGALLFELLSGRAPRVGRVEALTAALLAGEPVDLAGCRPGLPRDVLTVLATALAPERGDRYASAEDLARDLGHLLDRRPIEARPVGPATRLLRWVQRRPARAAALALAVLLPTSLAIQQHLANRAVQAQFARAEANLEQALQALDVFVWELSTGPHQDSLMDEAELLALLDQAGATLERLIVQRPDDVHVRCRWIQVQAAAAQCLLGLGDLDGAQARLTPALELGAALEVDPGELRSSHNAQGLVHERCGALGAALAHFDAALTSLPGAGGLDQRLAESSIQANRARVLRQLGRSGDAGATASAAEAAATQARLLARRPSDTLAADLRLGAALNQRALAALGPPTSASQRRGGHADGQAAFLDGLDLLDELVERHPGHRDVLLEATALHVNAPLFLELDGALPLQERAQQLAARLVASEPDQLDGLVLQIQAENGLANTTDALGLRSRSAGHRARAAALAERAVARAPDDLPLLAIAAQVDVGRAGELVMLERRGEACEPAARASSRLARAMATLGDQPQLRLAQAWAAIHEGYGRLALGQAERALERARAVPSALAESDPVICVAVGELLAGCALLAPEPEEALVLRIQALERLERGVDLGFSAADYLRSAAEWDGLRDDPRFRLVLRRLGAPVD